MFIFFRLRFQLSLLVFLIVPAQFVFAEDADDLFSLSLNELIQVKVTIANRVEESFTDAPSSVTVITRREIEQLGVNTLTELLNYVPGFQSYMSPHESNRSVILARGLAYIYGSNLLLMIDGHRINDEYTGGFTFADHLLGLYNVKQVEFIRGPGSALYGSNALSGVINIITEPSKTAKVTVGSNQAKGVSASSFGSVGGFNANASFDYYADEGQRYTGLTDKNGFNKATQDPVDVFQGRAGLQYKRSRLSFEYMNTKLRDYYVYRRISNGVNLNDSRRFGINLDHDLKLAKGWQGNFRLGFMRQEREQRAQLSPSNTFLINYSQQEDTREAQVDLNKLTQSGHQLSAGAYWGFIEIPKAVDSENVRFVLGKAQRRTLGIYAQDQFDLLDKLRLTAGVRFDDYSDFGNSLNPRLALLYRWRKNNSFKLMYGRAYQAPSLGDLYDKENLISSGNLFLKPIIVNTYELAYLHVKANNNFIVTWFYNNYSDFISTGEDTAGGTVFDNLYNNQSQGLEIDIRQQLTKRWSLRSGLTYTISNNTQAITNASFSKPEMLAPSTYGNVQLNYIAAKWNWNTSVVANDGISVLQDQGMLAIVNSKFLYKIHRQWEVGFNIRNLLDTNRYTPQNQVIGQDQLGRNVQQMPSRGREFFLTLQYMRPR